MELLDKSGWNEGLVREEFDPINVECILSIPLPSVSRQDEIVWHYGKQGKFSVKTAYSLACELAITASSSNQQNWRLVWDLQLAPKIKLFIWKVCDPIIHLFER
ncbi:UNVERIFIED_CONTAM: hypothetical protein Slati_3824700 [Sesamum latifolium]|uniref:Reverse transcriptase zinc-binding domain-containing protein n=1 Tax=Sesamum latifolium TaxID=2727402 RepID=A0AAW2TLL5_9LAMI